MTEQQRVDKLKSRMSRWQAYVDRPSATPEQQAVVSAETASGAHQSRTVRPFYEPQPGLLIEPTTRTSKTRDRNPGDALPSDPLTDLQEARIADLKIAIVREREQADRMADEVLRAQNLHAATLYSHLVDEKTRQEDLLRRTQLPIPQALPFAYEDARRKNLMRLFGLFLVVTSILVAAFFVSR